jgi:hypothetical protein
MKKQNRQLKATGSNTPSTVSTQTSSHTIQRNFTYKDSNKIFSRMLQTYMRIEGIHTIAAVSLTKNFNTWGWPYWPKHVVFLRTFKNFKSFTNFKCECEELTSVCTQDGELIVIEIVYCNVQIANWIFEVHCYTHISRMFHSLSILKNINVHVFHI